MALNDTYVMKSVFNSICKNKQSGFKDLVMAEVFHKLEKSNKSKKVRELLRRDGKAVLKRHTWNERRQVKAFVASSKQS